MEDKADSGIPMGILIMPFQVFEVYLHSLNIDG